MPPRGHPALLPSLRSGLRPSPRSRATSVPHPAPRRSTLWSQAPAGFPTLRYAARPPRPQSSGRSATPARIGFRCSSTPKAARPASTPGGISQSRIRDSTHKVSYIQHCVVFLADASLAGHKRPCVAPSPWPSIHPRVTPTRAATRPCIRFAHLATLGGYSLSPGPLPGCPCNRTMPVAVQHRRPLTVVPPIAVSDPPGGPPFG